MSVKLETTHKCDICGCEKTELGETIDRIPQGWIRLRVEGDNATTVDVCEQCIPLVRSQLHIEPVTAVVRPSKQAKTTHAIMVLREFVQEFEPYPSTASRSTLTYDELVAVAKEVAKML